MDFFDIFFLVLGEIHDHFDAQENFIWTCDSGNVRETQGTGWRDYVIIKFKFSSVYFCVLKMFLKNFKFFIFFSLLQINIF
jgi:hypothetical protein